MGQQALLKKNNTSEEFLSHINFLDNSLFQHFKDVIKLDKRLTRQLVSFQANKTVPVYRWYKYKEAFSSSLVEYLLKEYKVPAGTILDPFAGVGTSLFAASESGYDAEGIELLPIGSNIIKTKLDIINCLSPSDISRLCFWRDKKPYIQSNDKENINYLRITKGAYPEVTEKYIEKYLAAIKKESNPVQNLLLFALLCVLESISFTRKDGQYLRWDYRSGRRRGGNKFNKGKVFSFDEAITSKLDEIIKDIEGYESQLALFNDNKSPGKIKLYSGSCLKVMPEIDNSRYQAVITSPPYCNRYDYTRTYALELALLGVNENELLNLRQEMLSCTVENREKELLSINPLWGKPVHLCENNELLQAVIGYLEYKKEVRELNNNGIPRMVKGYFHEMACVIQECCRTLKKGGVFFMVNDNVRYAGASISVDLILSKIAEDIGFHVENILILPDGKGNSSQQMGAHGREQLRKCVYVWRKIE